MGELKTMTDYELAQRIEGYRNRLKQLMVEVSQLLEDRTGTCEGILSKYKCLKNEVKADAHYVSLIANRKGFAKHYYDISRAIREAAAFGFTAPTNSAINMKLYTSISEAHYKLGKCHPERLMSDV